ncbi:MAG TPA: FAD-dependent oxidoreductase [Thermoplasmata archaeon]|nr:FAD-dependent oxidoreductase [Thermoplasmata archaeon]
MVERFDLVVLGAGLTGSAIAFHAVQDTASRVLLVDTTRAVASPSSTATSAGILSVQGWDPWDLGLVRESADEYRRLSETYGASPVRHNGGVRVARTEEGARWLERVARVLRTESADVRAVDHGELRDLLPFAEFEGIRGAIHTPEDAVVSAPDLAATYRRAARLRGARIEADAGASLTATPGGGWELHGACEARAERLVVACGPWTKGALRRLGYSLPLAPFRAQVVTLRPRPLLPTFPTLHDLDVNVYVRPAPSGRILAGDGTGTREEDPDRWEANADPGFVEGASAGVRDLFSGLRSLSPENAWAGLCAATPDRFPLVGPVPGASGLYVACGFNGLGTMRAGALARRLADGIAGMGWEGLSPAGPDRFPSDAAPFDPRPEFPLEAPEGTPLPPAPRAAGSGADAGASSSPGPPWASRPIGSIPEVGRLRWSPLSEWFDPLLPLFAEDALRTGGAVEVVEDEGRVRGLFLTGSSEGVGSGFTRSRAVATSFLDRSPPGGIYLEEPWRTGAEPVEVFAADLRDWEPSEPMRNSIRIAAPSDLPGLRQLMRGEIGPGVDPWLATLPRPEETAFLCEMDGRPVGVSWLSRVGSAARGHSFVVHPRYRGIGIGTDLLTARMLWLQSTGGRTVVSEIYDGNLASRRAAERAGMAPVATMYHFRPPAPGPAGGP